ncbi:hypothetical protein BCV70DRAFT_201340 [Testicularia cyperi]|uniref:FK506-binding protein n=1 Tax=Testicularia cyperi TaxID=1882483 RepID=A0A317XMU2_9BASI|nr:hypothetical protein BCV70DRAFT_201340 [Testicularia cyperi]
MAATPIAFFGLKLTPGKVQRMDVSRDFKVTNISYADEPKAGSKTLVKVHYTHIPGFDEEDVYDDEDEKTDDKEQKQKDAEDEVDVEKVYTLCSLSAGKVEQAVVDLQFCQEELIGFSITGDTPVDLVGNYVASPDFYDQEPDSDEMFSDDEEEEDLTDGELYDSDMIEGDFEEDDDEDMEEDSTRFEEITEKPPKKQAKAIEAAPVALPASKKRAATVAEDKKSSEAAASSKKLKGENGAAAAAPAKKAAAAAAKEKEATVAKAAKTTTKDGADVKAKPAAKEDKMKVTKLPSGLEIQEKTSGNGPPCKAGQKVSMRYVGRLTNGKTFDQCVSGKPFSFKLGRGEVIKGWDEGVKGMRVGGERRLTCPPNLAYGNQKLPGIPARSTLVFDVKLLEIK